MKILFIAMPSVHFMRWAENLSEAGHELYWFDILNRGTLERLDTIKQFIDWKQRKIPYIKGEYFLSRKFPAVFNRLQPYLETTVHEALEKVLKEVQPDVVHSFEMQSCSYPIVQTMNRFKQIPWLYSCWGNDIYYYSQIPNERNAIQKVLKRVNFMHSDCYRDAELAKQNGFTGKYLNMIPTGGGYHLETLEPYRQPLQNRKMILVKGYQHIFGRALNVVKALEKIQDKIGGHEVVVFGAHPVVEAYIHQKQLPFLVYGRHDLEHDALLKLMGKAKIYVGNNISDGMPNTLLEAIVMGAYPIQSDPGGASAEIITDGENGMLINDPEDIAAIATLIQKAIANPDNIEKAFERNTSIAKEKLSFEPNRKKIVDIYREIEINNRNS